MTSSKDWFEWHAPYNDPETPLSRRLAIVKQALRKLLPDQPDKPVKLISVCAGQGLDVVDTLIEYPHSRQVQARLIELNEANVREAQQHVWNAGLSNVEVVLGDAANLAAYQGVAPADIVLICGVFGNVSNNDIFQIIDTLPQLCKKGAGIIWTRSRRDPDITPTVREYFTDHSFVEESFVAPDDVIFSVGVNRFEGKPQELDPDGKMFEFVI